MNATVQPRGTVPPANSFVEETHNSSLIAVIFLIAVTVQINFAMTVPIRGIRVTLALGAGLMLACAALAWDGFHYGFSPAGVAIRTLGFRLRFIPAADIREYAAASWSVAGGYGIRGLGARRAYVWGNRGVRIKTIDGEAFLGHGEPEKIIRDLDLITGNHEAREASW